ncbi:MAG: hypothetical protein HYW02_08825 [Deltaproteobacteria bacterium]|nr:hypothetical protein [Deltaproteobacteria bacterium]
MKRYSLLILLLFSLSLEAAPFSDLAREEFQRGPQFLSPVPRSPFQPGQSDLGAFEIDTVVVQGVVWGEKIRMALLSDFVVNVGDKLGSYLIKEISQDGVILSYGGIEYPLKLPHLVKTEKGIPRLFHVEFQNAALRDALSLLSRAADLNLIAPEGLLGQVTVSFHDVDLIQAIRSILRVNGYEYAIESGIIRVGRPDDFAGGTDLLTTNFRLKFATAKNLVDSVKPLLSDRGQVIADERSNTLTVKDRDAVIASIREMIEVIDRRDQQVRIEARIVDATRDFSRALGIRWGLKDQSGDFKVSGTKDVGKSADTDTALNVNLGTASPTSGIGFIIGNVAGLDIESQITAAEQKGDVKILSQPAVTTLNNMPAKIRSGTKIYVKSTSTISLGTSGGTSASGDTGGLQQIDTGIELTVTPQISVDDFIKMKIDATQSEADFSRTVDGIPAVVDSTASTTVLLGNGATTVIGGLYRVRTSNQVRGVPGLHKVPVVGYFFRHKSRTKTDTELMIFITPKIVKS